MINGRSNTTRGLLLWAWPVGVTALLAAGCGSQNWATDLARAQAESIAQRRLLIMAFTRPLSPACGRMDAETLSRPEVQRRLSEFVRVRVDFDRRPDVAGAFGVQQAPSFVVLHPDGGLLGVLQGYQKPAVFLEFLEKVEELK